MDGYVQISLKDLLGSLKEDKVREILSSFSCPQNLDVETFLKQKAAVFAEQGRSTTYLVFCSFKGDPVLIGYYTLTLKILTIPKNKISKSLAKRVRKFGDYDNDLKGYVIPSVLIGQLGKNYNNGWDKLITGDELLKMACDQIRTIYELSGGKTIYLECEDKECLKSFYSRNGFCNFGTRALDPDEKDSLSGEYLVQMFKYL